MNRLLIVIPSLEIGGAEQLAIAQLNALYEQGYKVYLAVISDKVQVDLRSKIAIPNEDIVFVGGTNDTISIQALRELFFKKGRLVQFCKKKHVTKLLAHLPLGHIWGRIIKSNLPDIELVCYHHSLQYSANPINSLTKRIFHLFNYRLGKKYDDLHIFISNAVQNDIKSKLAVKNSIVINNAIKDNYNYIKKKEGLSRSICNVNIVLPGRLHPVKGHLFFLEAFARLLKNTERKVFLTFTGGGAYQPEIEKKIALLQLGDYCKITGTLSNSELLSIIYENDLVVIPSLFEGMGIVAVEALMLGKTILASTAGGLSEVIQDGANGYSFEVNNLDDCYQKLRDIVEHFEEKKINEEVLRSDFKKRFEFQNHIKVLCDTLGI